MNWATLSSLLILVAGPLSGIVASSQRPAGAALWSAIAFPLGGLVLGLALAAASSKVCYIILDAKRMPFAIGLSCYLLMPMILLYLAVAAPLFVVDAIFHI